MNNRLGWVYSDVYVYMIFNVIFIKTDQSVVSLCFNVYQPFS